MSKRAFRRPIWEHDKRYDFRKSVFSENDLKLIARLQSVESAKKQTPVIPLWALLEIGAAAKAMPKAEQASEKDIIEYLENRSRWWGAGNLTLICMLAAETGGQYPPMDKKLAEGFRKRAKIEPRDEQHLKGIDIAAFAKAYIKVIKPWLDSRAKRRPEEADRYWAEAL